MRKFAVIFALVASFFCAQTAAANLVTNGGFETGDFTGWAQWGAEDILVIKPDSLNAHSGDSYVLKMTDAISYISQAVPTTPGKTYELRFWLRTDIDLGQRNQFLVQWAGTTLPAISYLPQQDYTEYVFTNLTPASGSSSDLTFALLTFEGGMFLDDVSVNVLKKAVSVPLTLLLLD